MNSSCPQIRRLLIEYLYEELPEDQVAEVRHHLQQCPGCHEEFELCQRLLTTIDSATPPPPHSNPTAGLLQRINWQIDNEPRYHKPKKASILTTRVLALAASFLLGIVAAPYLLEWTGGLVDHIDIPARTPVQNQIMGAPGGTSANRPWGAAHIEDGQIPQIDWTPAVFEGNESGTQPKITPTATPRR